jgi:MFS family permease
MWATGACSRRGRLHAFASNSIQLAAFRFLLGIGEPGNFMAAFKAISEWYPPKERAFVNGLVQAGSAVGAIVAAPLVAWTVAVWLVPALAAWTMLRALDLHLPFIASWAVLAFVGLGISIPSAPGYVGVFHAAAVLAVGLFGVSHSAGVGYALLFHASQILPITLLGWLYLLREQVSLTEAAHATPRRLS